MPTKKVKKDVYEFDDDFQKTILQYTVSDKLGYQALENYHPDYFALLELSVIAHGLKSYYKAKKNIPQSKVVFKEHLRKMYLTRDFKDLLSSDKKLINKALDDIYSGPVKDGEEVMNTIMKFNSYSQLKTTLETLNLKDFGQYETFSKKVRDSINVANLYKRERPLYLLADAKRRVTLRGVHENVIPLPYHQMNGLINAGGYNKASFIVILGPEKSFKTLSLINFAKEYLKRKKTILYVDLENGEYGLGLRTEQSILNKSKEEILSGQYDEKLLKMLRKYKRLGGELVIRRMPAYTTTCAHIQHLIDDIYREDGKRFDGIIFDYAVLMGAISGKKDDTERISDAYLDMKNLIEYNGFDFGLTAHHITREGKKRKATCYQTNDTAKCIDIVRHVDAMWGINQSDEEAEAGVMRLEIVAQRDGAQSGRAFFWVSAKNQRMKEFNKAQVQEVRDNYRNEKAHVDSEEIEIKKKKVKNADI